MKPWQILFFGSVATMLTAAEPPTPELKPLAVAEIKRSDPIDFEREILPALKDNCLACHNQTKAKADLILETPQAILKGGESGPAVVPGKGAESLLFRAAAHRGEPAMPPRENKVAASNLSAEQLGLLKLWIDEGAKGEVRAAPPIEWRQLPEGLNPIYAVALSQDGQFAACGRANEIFVYHVHSRQLIARLRDLSLRNESGAHRDLVQSLAFNPDATLLASGSYREVKLWRRATSTQPLRLGGTDTAGVQIMAVSPNGKWLATAGAENAIGIWDLAAGQLIRSLTGHEKPVTALKFSPDSARICSGSSDNSLRIWNAEDGTLIGMTNTASEIAAVTWIGEHQLASGGADKLIRVWDLDETNLITPAKELSGHEATVASLETVPGVPGQIISGSADGTLRQWDVAKGEAIRLLKHEGPVTAVAVRQDGKRFASVGMNNVARLWNAEDGKMVAEMKGDRYAQEAALEAERLLTVAAGDVAYRKSGVESAEKQNQTQTERLKKAEESFATADKTHTEKKQALTSATDTRNTAEKSLTDLKTEVKKVSDEFNEAEKTAQLAASDAKTAAANATQTKLAADRATQTKADTEKVAADATAIVARAKAGDTNASPAMLAEAEAVAAKARAFAEAVAADAAAKLKLAEEAKVMADKAIDLVATRSFAAGELRVAYERTTNSAPQRLKEATDKLTSASNAFVAAEKEFKKAELTRSTTDNELQLAKAAAKQSTDSLMAAKAALESSEHERKQKEAAVQSAKNAAKETERPLRAVAFSPDNLALATAGDADFVQTWSADNGVAFETLRGQTGSVGAVSFTANSALVSAGADKGIIVWDLKPAWTLQRTIGSGDIDSPITDRVMAVKFSRDGQHLATGSGEPSRSGEIKLWEVASGRLLHDFSSVHSDTVLSLDFSPDNRFLASGAADKFARVVDLESGKVLKAFEGHTHHVLGVSWKRDGRSLATAGADNVVKVWDFSTGERKKNIEGFNKEVASISFIGVTDQALTASGDSQVRIVRDNGENVRSFSGAADYMYSASATPDGKIVVAGGQDSVLRIWSGTDGNVMMTFPPPSK